VEGFEVMRGYIVHLKFLYHFFFKFESNNVRIGWNCDNIGYRPICMEVEKDILLDGGV
jgi:hypothetical protein